MSFSLSEVYFSKYRRKRLEMSWTSTAVVLTGSELLSEVAGQSAEHDHRHVPEDKGNRQDDAVGPQVGRRGPRREYSLLGVTHRGQRHQPHLVVEDALEGHDHRRHRIQEVDELEELVTDQLVRQRAPVRV